MVHYVRWGLLVTQVGEDPGGLDAVEPGGEGAEQGFVVAVGRQVGHPDGVFSGGEGVVARGLG